MAAIGQRMTVEEFLQIPEETPPLELIGGEIEPKMSPDFSHIVAQEWLKDRVNSLRNPGYRAFTEWRVNFGGASVIPDVSVVAFDDLPLDAHGNITGRFGGAPVLVFEVLSEGQAEDEVIERCRRFVSSGVRAAVVVNIRDGRMTVVRSAGNASVVTGDEVVELGDIVPGLAFSANELVAGLVLRPFGQ
jgi:Uma2 family endonuclease